MCDIFYIGKSFTISTEHQDKDVLVVHCDVVEWSHTVMKKIYKEFAKLLKDSSEAGYKFIDTYSPNHKFCEMVCFTDMGIDFEYEGKMHSHYRYYLEES